MSVYTVHQPPLRTAGVAADPNRFVFVRDGFSWWAFLLTPLWMLRHRLWLVLAAYLAICAAIDVVLHALGASIFAFVVVGALISLLAGLEAATLRRLKLAGADWHNVGVVTGNDLEDAERRFFDAWIRQAPARRAAPPQAPPSGPQASPPAAQEAGVIGLFPEPGVPR